MININNDSEEKQLKAIKRNPFDIRFIDNPSEQVQLEAVREAVKQFPGILDDLFKWIKNPCQEVLDIAMIKDIIE